MSTTVRLHRVLRAPPERVYRALLDADAKAKSLPPNGLTGKLHHLDAKVGGSCKMSFTNFSTGQRHTFGGTYVELTPNERIRYTDQFDEPNLPGEIMVTITLKALSCGTELHVVQEGLPDVSRSSSATSVGSNRWCCSASWWRPGFRIDGPGWLPRRRSRPLDGLRPRCEKGTLPAGFVEPTTSPSRDTWLSKLCVFPPRMAMMAAPLLLTAVMAVASATGGVLPNQPVSALDLTRYAGQWHEIAHLPMYFQRKCVDQITATYAARANGRIDVRNGCRTKAGDQAVSRGIARPVDGQPGALKVRFAPDWLAWLPWVWADYWVIELDPGYQWAVVGSPSRKYLWVLSRKPTMAGDLFRQRIANAKLRGYPVDRLVMAAPLD